MSCMVGVQIWLTIKQQNNIKQTESISTSVLNKSSSLTNAKVPSATQPQKINKK